GRVRAAEQGAGGRRARTPVARRAEGGVGWREPTHRRPGAASVGNLGRRAAATRLGGERPGFAPALQQAADPGGTDTEHVRDLLARAPALVAGADDPITEVLRVGSHTQLEGRPLRIDAKCSRITATTAPICINLPSRPLARARRRAGSHGAIVPVEQVKRPAWAPPMPSRASNNSGSPASAVSPLATDQAAANRVRARRVPQVWASQPLGICKSA